MTDRIGIARFPGVGFVRRCSYTRSYGASPGRALLEIAPQASVAPVVGTLALLFTGAPPLILPNCRIQEGSFRRDGTGQIIGLAVADRRWAWSFNGSTVRERWLCLASGSSGFVGG